MMNDYYSQEGPTDEISKRMACKKVLPEGRTCPVPVKDIGSEKFYYRSSGNGFGHLFFEQEEDESQRQVIFQLSLQECQGGLYFGRHLPDGNSPFGRDFLIGHFPEAAGKEYFPCRGGHTVEAIVEYCLYFVPIESIGVAAFQRSDFVQQHPVTGVVNILPDFRLCLFGSEIVETVSYDGAE